MNATTTVPPVLDEKADPVGYNVDKLRAIAGSLATQRGKKDAGKSVLRAVDATLAALRDGCDPSKAIGRIGSAGHALKNSWGVTAPSGLPGLPKAKG